MKKRTHQIKRIKSRANSTPNTTKSGKTDPTMLLEKTILRDNWNIYVGDRDFKTDMYLRFNSSRINTIY